MSEQRFKKVSPDEAKEILDSQHPLLVDVRPKTMYEKSHIPGAIDEPWDTINAQSVTDFAGPDKDRPIMLYCMTGVHSAMAAERLYELGYRDVYDIEGGIKAWPYDVVEGK